MDKFSAAVKELKTFVKPALSGYGGPLSAEKLVEILGVVEREYQKLLAHVREEAALRNVEQQMANLEGFEAIGNLLIDVAIEQTGAERGFLMIRAGDEGEVHRVVVRGISHEESTKGPSNTVVKYVLHHKEPILSRFSLADPRFMSVDGSTVLDRPREILAIPIPGKEGPLGCLYVDRIEQATKPQFTNDHLRFLLRLADPMRQSIEKANLIESLKAQVSQVRKKSAFEPVNVEEELADRMRFLLDLRGQNVEVVQKLMKAKLAKVSDLERALQISRKQSISITRALLADGTLDAKVYLRFVQEEMKIPYVNMTSYIVDQRVLTQVPREVCERYLIMPLLKVEETMTVAMVDPLDPFIIEILQRTYGASIRPMVAAEEDIHRAIETFYGKAQMNSQGEIVVPTEEQKGFLELVSRSNKVLSALRKKDAAVGKAVESNMLELVNVVVESGIRLGASDVHIQPEEATLRVRYRIDGYLHTVMDIEKRYTEGFISSLKVMAKLDIAERRLPQDGKVVFEIDRRKVDLRVSTLPATNGEKVVIRVLDRLAVNFDLDALGFEPDVLTPFKEFIRRPNGMVLVTGPTGSGKTTTLYGALSILNAPDTNVITLEDPVEFTLEGVTQAQTHARIGFDFAAGLRSILRQDPDIIMVGEIRDSETAEIAARSALTGHLVFSTLHTNDAAGAVTRLMDLGINGFLVGETLLCVLAQRLVRVVCSGCKVAGPPEATVAERLKLAPEDRKLKYARGRGCATCNQTGYKGRVGLYELLQMNGDLRKLIFNSKDPDQIRALATSQGMRTLRHEGLVKARKGMTTLEEVLAVTGAD